MAVISEYTLPKGNEGMTLLGTRNDDTTVTLPSIAFGFPFNNATITSIFVSGNSWLGIGGNTEHLKINRRDASYNSLYYATEVEYGVNTFRIRFEGNSVYNNWSLNDLFWEVTFFEEGVIRVVIEKSPNSGVDSFLCPDNVTITTKFESGKSYILLPQNEEYTTYLIEEGSYIPSESKYLMVDSEGVKSYIADENEVYSWVKVTDEPINVDMFLEFGIDTLPNDLTGLLATPKLMYYTDNPNIVAEKENFKLEVKEVVTSKPKLIVQKSDFVIEDYQTIELITVDTNIVGGNIRVAFSVRNQRFRHEQSSCPNFFSALSVDGGISYMTYNDQNHKFVDIDDPYTFLEEGIAPEEFATMNYSKLNGLINGSLRFAYVLDKPLLTDVCKIKVVKIKYADV